MLKIQCNIVIPVKFRGERKWWKHTEMSQQTTSYITRTWKIHE